MRIARLELKDIGPFEDAVFEMPEPKGAGELVLFEGPNGSGKTTILQTIAVAVSEVGFGPHVRNVGGVWVPTRLITSPPLDEVNRRSRSPSAVRVLSFEHHGSQFTISSAPYSSATNHVAEVLERFWNQVRGSKNEKNTIPWSAFAYRAHHPSAKLETPGPKDITEGPLDGVLSFGDSSPASALVGQLLTNIEFDRVKAALYAQESKPSDKRDEMARISEARRDSLRRFEHVLSRTLDRTVSIEFPFGQHAPGLEVDGKNIPVDMLGEGMRSTASWLSDLLARLERISWADTSRSPLDQEFWLLLDEVEESLHPTMQAHIFPALRALFPNARIYATTHSPFVVASVGEGTVFPIRPARDHEVRGRVEARALQPGQSLELVTDDIFQAPVGFVDKQTRDDLEAHDRDVQTLQRKKAIDWDAFWARRDRLMKLNEEVSTMVAMQEVRVQQEVLRRMRERIADKEREANP